MGNPIERLIRKIKRRETRHTGGRRSYSTAHAATRRKMLRAPKIEPAWREA